MGQKSQKETGRYEPEIPAVFGTWNGYGNSYFLPLLIVPERGF
jgi:hypothetical protein